jgi:hypothetical protein
MNTKNTIRKTIGSTVFSILLGLGASQTLVADDSLDQFYRTVLFNPSNAIQVAEARGRVTIYDGLDSEEVDRAMDTQFDRIENMMFVGIRHTMPDGSVEEEDDCDY